MAFKMKGFPMHKGVSPMREQGDPSSGDQKDAFDADPGNYDTPTATTPVVEEETEEEEESGTSAGDLSNVVPKAFTAKNEDGADIGAGLDKAKKDGEEEKLKAQSKKEMYANAWQNSGAGHIVEAVKSIRRGIKNLKTKKAKRVSEAKTAEGEGTETLKQAKLVKRAKKKEDKKLKSKIKDQKKLKKYRKKNPVTGKEAISKVTNQNSKKLV